MHIEYDWCVTVWYDGPHRAWAVVLDGKAVHDDLENVTRVFGGMAPRWPNS